MKSKKLIALFLLTLLILAMTACTGTTVVSSQSTGSSVDATTSSGTTQQISSTTVSAADVEYDSEDLELNPGVYTLSYISLEGSTITTSGSGLAVEGSIVTILAPGAYSISGTLTDGQINVDTQEDGTVVLILNEANITSSTSAPIYVRNAEKVILNLAEGTQNTVTDGTSYILEDAASNEPNAAIFSKDDLVINGSGSLTVSANYNNGIVSKDHIKITGGSLTVNAVNDAIKGKDYIAILDGTFMLNAGGDGLQSNNDTDTTKGYIAIEGGTFNITALNDGIQAETSLLVSGGTIAIVTGGGSVNGNSASTQQGPSDWGLGNTQNETDSASAKGLKAGVDVSITGGKITIDSQEDAIHSNNTLTVSGGEIAIAAGDDALHADTALSINGGSLDITQAYEGIESQSITINDGIIHLIASDDGLNGSSGSGSGANMNASDSSITINGGSLYVDANGDGLDVNGPMSMTGGTVIVNGPTNDGNGALDYTGEFLLTGGTLVAVGSSGMAQAPSETSSLYSVLYGFDMAQSAGTLIHIADSSGNDVLTFMPTKTYQSVVIASPSLTTGSYTLFVGGTSSGTAADGIYSGGTYSGGTQAANFTISSIVTYAGSTGGGMFPGGTGPGGNPGGGRPKP